MSSRISVLMGIYNCATTLPAAIDSIVVQTYSDWELILCDDGSRDSTYDVAETYRKKYPDRIFLFRHEKNLGLNQTLNDCLKKASGEYIARMDGDDMSLPERFEKEVAFLDAHPDYAIVSAPMIHFDEHGEWGRGTAIEWPQAKDFISGTPFCHAPCMVRREAYEAVNGYSTDPKTTRVEDYDLWFRMYAMEFKGHNLQEPLYKMRDDENAYHRRKFRYCLHEAYVRFHGYRKLKLPITAYVCVVRPILVGLLPRSIYTKLHQYRKRIKGR